MRSFPTFFLIFLFPACLLAQEKLPLRLDASEREAFSFVERTADGSLLLGGSFEGTLALPDTTLISRGEADIFLCRKLSDGHWQLLLSGGGTDEEQLTVAVPLSDGSIILGGSFWGSATFNDSTLQSSGNPKGLFVLRLTATGEITKTRSISGSELKELSSLSSTPGRILVGGYFSQQLFLPNDTLQAQNAQDGFLLSLDNDLEIQWARQFPGPGRIRVQQLATDAGGHINVGGQYDEELRLGDTSLLANTTDWDVFVAALATQGWWGF